MNNHRFLASCLLVSGVSLTGCGSLPAVDPGDRVLVSVPNELGPKFEGLGGDPVLAEFDIAVSLEVDPESSTGFLQPNSLDQAVDQMRDALPVQYLEEVSSFHPDGPNEYFYDQSDSAPYVADVLIREWALLDDHSPLSEWFRLRYFRESRHVGRVLFLMLRLCLISESDEKRQAALKRLEFLAFIEESDQSLPVFPTPQGCPDDSRFVSRLVTLGSYSRVARVLRCGDRTYVYFWDTGWLDEDKIRLEVSR